MVHRVPGAAQHYVTTQNVVTRSKRSVVTRSLGAVPVPLPTFEKALDNFRRADTLIGRLRAADFRSSSESAVARDGRRRTMTQHLGGERVSMIRTLVIGTLLVLLAGGCGDRRHATVRGLQSESDGEGAETLPPPDAFHSMPPGKELPVPTGPEVELGPVRLTAPQSWVRKAPRIEFIRAEFALPRAEGDAADGRLTMSVAGGSLKENVDRWRQQFSGKPEKDSQETLKVEGVEVTLVDFSGTYNDQRGPFAPGVESPGYRMLGAIFDVGGQLHFIKAYGPAKTMAARAAEFRAFVQSLKPVKPAK